MSQPERIRLCVWSNDAVHVEDAKDDPIHVSRVVERVEYVRADLVDKMIDDAIAEGLCF